MAKKNEDDRGPEILNGTWTSESGASVGRKQALG